MDSLTLLLALLMVLIFAILGTTAFYEYTAGNETGFVFTVTIIMVFGICLAFYYKFNPMEKQPSRLWGAIQGINMGGAIGNKSYKGKLFKGKL